MNKVGTPGVYTLGVFSFEKHPIFVLLLLHPKYYSHEQVIMNPRTTPGFFMPHFPDPGNMVFEPFNFNPISVK